MEHDMEVRKHKGAPPQIGPSSEQDPPKLFVCTYASQTKSPIALNIANESAKMPKYSYFWYFIPRIPQYIFLTKRGI